MSTPLTHFNFATWLADYNETHQARFEALPLSILSLAAHEQRERWLTSINEPNIAAPIDELHFGEQLIKRDVWQAQLREAFNNEALWSAQGRYGQQIAFRPQAMEHLARWQALWQRNKAGAEYTDAACYAIVEQQALEKLIADHEQMLRDLATLPVLAAHLDFWRELRSAISNALQQVKTRQAQIIETILRRLECMQASDYSDADLYSAALQQITATGVQLPWQLPANGCPLTSAQWEAFYGYVSKHGSASQQGRLNVLFERCNQHGLVWVERADATPVLVPAELAAEIPKALTFWDQTFPSLFKGTWARWQLFEEQSLTQLTLKHLSQQINAYQLALNQPKKLAQFLAECQRIELLVQQSEQRLLGEPYCDLNRFFHQRSLSALSQVKTQLHNYQAEVGRLRQTHFVLAVQALKERFSLNALTPTMWQEYYPVLLSLVEQCTLDLNKGASSDESKLAFHKACHQLMVLASEFERPAIEALSTTSAVKAATAPSPAVMVNQRESGSSSEPQPESSAENEDVASVAEKENADNETAAQAGDTQVSGKSDVQDEPSITVLINPAVVTRKTLEEQVADVLALLASGEALPVSSLRCVEQYLDTFEIKGTGQQLLKAEYAESLQLIAQQCFTALAQNPFDLTAEQLLVYQQHIITAHHLLSLLNMKETLSSIEIKLEGYFLNYVDELLEIQMEYRAKQHAKKSKIEEVDAYDEVKLEEALAQKSAAIETSEAVITALSSSEHYHEFSLAEWVLSLQQARAESEWGLHVTGLQDAQTGVQKAQLKQHWLSNVASMNQTLAPWFEQQTLSKSEQQLLNAYKRSIERPQAKLTQEESMAFATTLSQPKPEPKAALLSFALQVNKNFHQLGQDKAANEKTYHERGQFYAKNYQKLSQTPELRVITNKNWFCSR